MLFRSGRSLQHRRSQQQDMKLPAQHTNMLVIGELPMPAGSERRELCDTSLRVWGVNRWEGVHALGAESKVHGSRPPLHENEQRCQVAERAEARRQIQQPVVLKVPDKMAGAKRGHRRGSKDQVTSIRARYTQCHSGIAGKTVPSTVTHGNVAPIGAQQRS